MRKELKWIFFVITLSFSLIASVGLFNYIIDPFNIFAHKNRCNILAVGFNERIQKSAYLKYNSTQNYDAILLGSSRATYYNQHDFEKMNLYNFSFSGAMPIEYSYYLEFAKKHNSKQFSTIILGLDFYTFNQNYSIQKYSKLQNKLLFFIQNYFSLDTIKYSVINCKRSLFHTTGHRSYNRENIVHSNPVAVEQVQTLAKKRSANYYTMFENYDKHYIEILNSLKERNPLSHFIVYTSPLSKEFLDVIYHDERLLEFYKLWLKNIVKVFDKVYCFTLPSEFSEHYEKYSLDGDHFYPKVGKIVAAILTDNKRIENYGIILNQYNLNEFNRKIEENK
jgi:hypothetical protein